MTHHGGSAVVALVIRIFAGLNAWYEASITHRFIAALGRCLRDSVFFGRVYRYFTTRYDGAYAQGSFVIRAVAWVVGGFFFVLKKIFAFFARVNETSVNRRTFSRVMRLFKVEVVRDSLPGRMVSSLPFLFCGFIFFMSVVPHAMWSNMLIVLAAVFFWGIFILQYFLGRRAGVDLKYLAPMLVLYVLFCVISFFTGLGGTDSIRVATIMFAIISLGVFATNVFETVADISRCVRFIFLALVVTGLYGIFQYATGIEISAAMVDLELNPGLQRAYSTMGNPNNYAKFIVMFLPFCVAYIFNVGGDTRFGATRRQFNVVMLTALCMPIMLALMLTYSRASYLALLVSAFIYILMIKPRLIAVGAVLAVLAVPFIPDAIMMRMSTIGTDTSSLHRLLIWGSVGQAIRDYWAQGIGIGPEVFTLIYHAYAPEAARFIIHSHNVFLSAWLEVGIGGFIAIILYNLQSLRAGVAAFVNSKDTQTRHYLAAGVSGLAAFFVFGIVEHVWFYPRTMLVYFLMMGLLWAAVRIDGKACGKAVEAA